MWFDVKSNLMSLVASIFLKGPSFPVVSEYFFLTTPDVPLFCLDIEPLLFIQL